MEISNVYVDFQLNIEEGTSIFNGQASCLVYTEDLDRTINVGEVSIYLFYPKKGSYLDVSAEAYCISTDFSTLLTRLPDICDIDRIQGLVATCHGLKINKNCCKKGIGTAFLEKLMKQLSYLNVKLALLIPNNFVTPSSLEDAVIFCDYLGFHESKKENQLPVMYRYLDDRLGVLES